MPINFIHAHLFSIARCAHRNIFPSSLPNCRAKTCTNIIKRIHIAVLMWFNSICVRIVLCFFRCCSRFLLSGSTNALPFDVCIGIEIAAMLWILLSNIRSVIKKTHTHTQQCQIYCCAIADFQFSKFLNFAMQFTKITLCKKSKKKKTGLIK